MRPQPDASSISIYVVRTRLCDTDLGGIVHHARYLEYLEAGRVEYLRRRGADYLDWTRRGRHLPVVDFSIRYRKSVRFDELLAIETKLVELGRATVTFAYRVLRGGSEGELVAEGRMMLAHVTDDLVPKRIPDDVAAILCSAETHPRAIDSV